MRYRLIFLLLTLGSVFILSCGEAELEAEKAMRIVEARIPEQFGLNTGLDTVKEVAVLPESFHFRKMGKGIWSFECVYKVPGRPNEITQVLESTDGSGDIYIYGRGLGIKTVGGKAIGTIKKVGKAYEVSFGAKE